MLIDPRCEQLLIALSKRMGTRSLLPHNLNFERDLDDYSIALEEHNCAFLGKAPCYNWHKEMYPFCKKIRRLLGRDVSKTILPVQSLCRIVFFTCSEEECTLLNLTLGQHQQFIFFQDLKEEFLK